MIVLNIVYMCSVVKEELSDDEAHLPCFNGRVVSWVSEAVFHSGQYIYYKYK